MKQNRRSFLALTAASTVPAFSQLAGASEPDTQVRVRRDKSNPLTKSELVNRRKNAVDAWMEATGVESRVALSDFDVESNESIVAYNLDMVHGTPTEYIGTLVDQENPQSATQQAVSVGTSDRTSKLHNRADKEAEQVKQKKNTFTTAGTDPGNWADWDGLAHTKNDKMDGNGDTCGWTIDYRSNPQESANHALTTEIRMEPKAAYSTESDLTWHNDRARIKHDWQNGTGVSSDQFQHAPGNTVGTTSKGWNLQAGLNSESVATFTIGYSENVTSPEIDIDDKSSPDRAEYTKHKIGISGDLKYNTVTVNTASVANTHYVDNDYVYNPYAVVVDIKGFFKKLDCTGMGACVTRNGNLGTNLSYYLYGGPA